MKKKLFYDGIYGEDSIEFIRETIYISSLEEVLVRHHGVIKNHVHGNLFQIFLLEEGKLQLNVNDDTIDIEGTSFFAIPRNVLHGIQTKENITGWVITLSDMAIERMLALDTDIIFDIETITIAKFDFDDPLFEHLYTTMHKCINEFNSNLPGKDFALEYLVGMLLIRLYRIPKKRKLSIISSDNAYNIYYRRFLQLISEMNDFKYPIAGYAEQLSISAGHLNRICREVSGKSPKDIVIEHFLDEAKVRLSIFETSIAEISFELGFESPNYFTRLFKNKLGLTPRDYRKKIGA
ncbi:helix-turn-helix transcriptional regulator [Muricauda sp. 334s03]|uniref:Helix-turn-helix transcriptional regulator n=1 Tax=Flagellimonas yonaguniensis TaxID=3031325 RepID=A0ABT5Y2C6_9FLAO|nr:helix-turn-helix transcriptional regulator [[Muricauda] yonaguniensis]MDF0717493.1 helix-turn-helix transcriptional regulator [[Muricauda] yonaguniensis]